MLFEIYLPTAIYDPVHEELLSSMIYEFGGVTVTQGKGYWRDSAGDLIAEEVSVYSSYASALEHSRSGLRCFGEDLADRLLEVTEEETILYTIDGSRSLVNRAGKGEDRPDGMYKDISGLL